MKIKDFYYTLPPELIAQTPLADRAASRLLKLDRRTGATEHKVFRNIADELRPGDCLVINDTKVIPARLIGQRKPSGARVETLLLTRRDSHSWEVLVKPGKKARPGDEIEFGGGLLNARVEDVLAGGKRLVVFRYEGVFEEILDRLGKMPLPPYIFRELNDGSRYQTVYATHEGSAAAPTAGLHFTEDLLAQIKAKGVSIARVTLHVGLGTFRPVKAANVEDHEMHSEFYHLEESQAQIMNACKRAGRRLICVGTTSCRTVESCASEDGEIRASSGWTDIFITPGYVFRAMDALITNFHLPESTLLMLAAALCSREMVLRAYEEAIRERYRFFSFGDAMFIY